MEVLNKLYKFKDFCRIQLNCHLNQFDVQAGLNIYNIQEPVRTLQEHIQSEKTLIEIKIIVISNDFEAFSVYPF